MITENRSSSVAAKAAVRIRRVDSDTSYLVDPALAGGLSIAVTASSLQMQGDDAAIKIMVGFLARELIGITIQFPCGVVQVNSSSVARCDYNSLLLKHT